MRAAYPLHYDIARPARFSRLGLLIRVLAFLVFAILGLSFGAVFAIAYVALPIYAAARLSGGAAYVEQDGPVVIAGLRWFAALSAWAGLVAEPMPAHAPEDTVRLDVVRTSRPTAGSALARLVTGVPSAIVLAVLCSIGLFVWLWAALAILVSEHIGARAFAYLAGVQRWSIRLLAYQASLVDDYPPFSFA